MLFIRLQIPTISFGYLQEFLDSSLSASSSLFSYIFLLIIHLLLHHLLPSFLSSSPYYKFILFLSTFFPISAVLHLGLFRLLELFLLLLFSAFFMFDNFPDSSISPLCLLALSGSWELLCTFEFFISSSYPHSLSKFLFLKSYRLNSKFLTLIYHLFSFIPSGES